MDNLSNSIACKWPYTSQFFAPEFSGDKMSSKIYIERGMRQMIRQSFLKKKQEQVNYVTSS